MLPQFRALEALRSRQALGTHETVWRQNAGLFNIGGIAPPARAEYVTGISPKNRKVHFFMSTSVFVLDKRHRPLMPCRPARARRLLRAGRARVVKRFPFVIRLVDRTVEQSEVQPVLIKLDPGSRETGAAVVRDDEKKASCARVLRHQASGRRHPRLRSRREAHFVAAAGRRISAVGRRAF